MRRSRTGPNRQRNLFSTDVGTSQLFVVLSLLETQFGTRLPAPLQDLDFLNTLPEDHWVKCPAANELAMQYTFWFRLEASDVVEVILQPSKSR